MSYTAWPTSNDLRDFLLAANITIDSLPVSIAQLRLEAAAGQFEQETKRQFIKSSEDETRFFNGSGTGEMVVDEYIDITTIKFILTPAQGVVQPLDYFQFEVAKYPKTKIQILQGPTNVSYGWWTYFPQGRSNIEVTGTWGYADTIPPQAWEAVLCLAGMKLADSARIASRGAITLTRDDDTWIAYSDKLVSAVSGWEATYKQAVKDYKRPFRDYLRRSTRTLI